MLPAFSLLLETPAAIAGCRSPRWDCRSRSSCNNCADQTVTVAILAQGTHWAVATSQAFFIFIASLPCPPNFHQARQKHMHIRTGNITFRWRPYRVECTGSLLTSEVKRHRARLVLGWGTAWEHPGVLPAFCPLRVKTRGGAWWRKILHATLFQK